jgi:hypothetical protein
MSLEVGKSIAGKVTDPIMIRIKDARYLFLERVIVNCSVIGRYGYGSDDKKNASGTPDNKTVRNL